MGNYFSVNRKNRIDNYLVPEQLLEEGKINNLENENKIINEIKNNNTSSRFDIKTYNN